MVWFSGENYAICPAASRESSYYQQAQRNMEALAGYCIVAIDETKSFGCRFLGVNTDVKSSIQSFSRMKTP